VGALLTLALLVVLGIAAAARATRAGLRSARARRLARQVPTPIARLRRDEVVRVTGRVAIDGTPLLRSPIEGRPCVGYYVGVDFFDASRHHVPRWFPVTEETVVAPFRVIGDDGSTVEIDADRYDLELHFVETGRVLEPPADRVGQVLRRRGEDRRFSARNLAYVEVALEPGARVSVVGAVLRPPVSGAGAYRRSSRAAELGPIEAGAPIRVELEAPPEG